MKDFFKKKLRPQPQNKQTDDSPLSGRHKKFLNRFTKKKAPVQPTIDNVPVADNCSDKQPPQFIKKTNMLSTAQQAYNNSTWYTIKGRIGRIQLLAYSMIWGIICSILLLATMMTGLGIQVINEPLALDSVPLIALSLLLLLCLVYSYTVITLPRRRLHDIGKSGRWLLLLFIPIANFYLLYLLYFKRGDADSNQYGLPPLPFNKIELILALLLPIFVILNIFFAMYIDNILQTHTTTIVSVPDNLNLITQPNEQHNVDDVDFESTNESVNAIDPQTDAQIQAAIHNAVNNSVNQVTYEQFLTEAKARILVDRSNQETNTTKNNRESTQESISNIDIENKVIESHVFVEENSINTDSSNDEHMVEEKIPAIQ